MSAKFLYITEYVFFWISIASFFIVFVIYSSSADDHVYVPIRKRYKDSFKVNTTNVKDWDKIRDIKPNNIMVPIFIAIMVGLALLYKSEFFYKNLKYRLNIDYDPSLAEKKEISICTSVAILFQVFVFTALIFCLLRYIRKYYGY